MAKDPAFLFYSQDWIVGCQTLTMLERGQYISILAQMHQQGRMTEETIWLLVGSVSDNLRSKFKLDSDGRWYQPRLELEIKKRSKWVKSREINGSKGGRPKKAYANHMVNHMEDENEDKELNKESDHFRAFEDAHGAYPKIKRSVMVEWEEFVQVADPSEAHLLEPAIADQKAWKETLASDDYNRQWPQMKRFGCSVCAITLWFVVASISV